MKTGIVTYGTYIPRYRIKIADIAQTWKKDPNEIIRALQVEEKSVPAVDEDVVTISIEAVHQALILAAPQLKPTQIEALFIGSESHPYAVNPTSTIVGELLGIGTNYLASDLEFACKAGTAGLQVTIGLLEANHIRWGIAIGSDVAQSKPHDILEYTSSSAGAAFLMGKRRCCADILAYTSYSSDTPDFWRRDGVRYPSHAGRFTGEPAYFTHVAGAAMRLLKQIKITYSLGIQDIDYCVFHMPNGKFPREVAQRLGFLDKQLAPSLIVESIGNPYSASTMLGFAAILDIAKPGQTIFMVSYGSGAGSDAFFWKTTQELARVQRKRKNVGWLVNDQITTKTYIDYTQYLKQTHNI